MNDSCSAFADPLAIELANIFDCAVFYVQAKEWYRKAQDNTVQKYCAAQELMWRRMNLLCALAVYVACWRKLHAR